MTDNKKYIIDPLTTLCKIALLYFMPENTKLAIDYHILHIQEYNYYQWIERMKNGDNRIDLANLNSPIIKAIKWYIIENDDKVQLDELTDQSIKIITKYSIKGLIKLQLMYIDDISINIILQYFINLLSNALNDKWDETKIVKDNNNVLTDKIKTNFESNIINSISKMFLDADQNETSINDVNTLAECIHKLLINRDNIFLKLMKDVNTIL